MLYPRYTESGELISDDQMVGIREHLAKKRILYMSGELAADSEFPLYLMALDSINQEPIKLIITSPGGELNTSFLIYDTIKMMNSPVYTLGRFCASAAVLLLASGAKRYLMPHAKVMLHLPSNYFSRDMAIQFQEMEIIQKESLKYKSKMVAILQECGVRKTKEEILRDIDRDFWLEPQEAIEYGLADEIITPKIMEGWLK